MPTLAEVRQQIAAYPDRYIFWTGKEVRALPAMLDQHEQVRAVTSGMMDGSTWLVVCTTRRVIFLNRGMFWGTREVQIPLDRIQSIDYSFTIFFGSITIWDGASAFTANMVLKSSILPFVKVTQALMYEIRRPQAPAAATHPVVDVATELAKLAELKEKGYLTEEEFLAQKKKLLA